jgi:hypothetical protein
MMVRLLALCAIGKPCKQRNKKKFMSVVSLPHLHIVYSGIFARDASKLETEMKCLFSVISSIKAVPLHFEFPLQFNMLIWAEFIRKVVHGFAELSLSVLQPYPNLLRANVEPEKHKTINHATVKWHENELGTIYWLLLLNYFASRFCNLNCFTVVNRKQNK